MHPRNDLDVLLYLVAQYLLSRPLTSRSPGTIMYLSGSYFNLIDFRKRQAPTFMPVLEDRSHLLTASSNADPLSPNLTFS